MDILLDAPDLGDLEKKKLNECIDSTFVSTAGPFIGQFAGKFAAFLGITNAVPVQSGTAALHLALLELGVGPGDEVILPVLTFIATANAVMYTGAKPVFADVDPETWNISPDDMLAKITPRTKAIIVVHLYGNPCDMGRILDISREKKVPIIEDATESLGATWKGAKTGTLGEIGCFSFNGNKVITTGGGGMITCADDRKSEHMFFLANQARENSLSYDYSDVGFNYRMTNLEASLGLAQMERLQDFLEKKRKISHIYREHLQDVEGVSFQKEHEEACSSWWLTSLVMDRSDFNLDLFMTYLQREGIPSRKIFTPITDFKPYRPFTSGNYEIARNIFHKGINLPSSTVNSEEKIEYVASKVRGYFEGVGLR